MINIIATKEVRAYWVYNQRGYLYKTMPGSLVADASEQSISFKLTELNGYDWDVEASLIKREDGYWLRTERYMGGEQLPLKAFDGPGELILYFDDGHSHAYFHLTN
jgi:hypothetical protein